MSRGRGTKAMLNLFPGMNPYLEQPELWHQAHNRLIVAIADELTPQIVPKYHRALSLDHSDEVSLFCSHDAIEYKTFVENKTQYYRCKSNILEDVYKEDIKHSSSHKPVTKVTV